MGRAAVARGERVRVVAFDDGYFERLQALEAAGLSTTIPDTVWGSPWVYCGSHLRVHGTGWCTVYNTDKVPLAATMVEDATAQARAAGLHIYGDPRPCRWCQRPVTDAPTRGSGTYRDSDGQEYCHPGQPRSPRHDPRRS